MGEIEMVVFWVGVSGFSYASWKGAFYPEGTKPENMLEAYSRKLNSVEINSSFYHMPTQSTTSKWAICVQGDFRFSFKANRRITHIKKLRDVAVDTDIFLKGVKPVGSKLGCILAQLPPYMKQDYDTLETFLKQKPDSIRVALEFRHSTWFGDTLNEVLSKYNVALCVADTEEMKPLFCKTASFTYARLRKDHYSKSDLKDWADRLLKFAEGSSDCFVYFKHDETGQAANTAVEFRTMLNG
jgi:uncharacterized protein YecE (DUF72 family)